VQPVSDVTSRATYRSAPGAVTENITDRFSCFRFSNSRRRVSRAHVGAYSGHVRAEGVSAQRRATTGSHGRVGTLAKEILRIGAAHQLSGRSCVSFVG